MEEFADKIATLCINKYKNLKKTGKPTDNEWTVLSGIVMSKDEHLSVVSLCTGTKCLGREELSRMEENERGSKLSDSHAEVLARRAFLRFLYEQINLVLDNEESQVFSMDRNEEKIILQKNVTFHMFSSQTPCGDCSIVSKKITQENIKSPPSKMRKMQETKDDKGIEPFGDIVHRGNDSNVEDIHRTGAKCVAFDHQDLHLPGLDYHVTGPLRTKPGRGDPTLSLSCSDKIAKWNLLGMQGALLSLFIPSIKVETIVIGGNCPFTLEAMERGVFRRFHGYKFTGPKIIQANVSFDQRKDIRRSQPCPSSIIWCWVRNKQLEVAVEGRRQGATKKKGAGSLLVSRRALFGTFIKICDKLLKHYPTHPKRITYYHCKQSSRDYKKSWETLKSTTFRNWPSKPLVLQDFVL